MKKLRTLFILLLLLSCCLIPNVANAADYTSLIISISTAYDYPNLA